MQITVKKCNKTILIIFQHQSKVSASLASGDLLTSSACVGADTLLKLLGNYCRNKDIKTAITVGIVGMSICNVLGGVIFNKFVLTHFVLFLFKFFLHKN